MPVKMKVCNVADYTESLRKRGNIFSFFEKTIEVWYHNEVEQCERSKYI
jgi:hypothetical protein